MTDTAIRRALHDISQKVEKIVPVAYNKTYITKAEWCEMHKKTTDQWNYEVRRCENISKDKVGLFKWNGTRWLINNKMYIEQFQ